MSEQNVSKRPPLGDEGLGSHPAAGESSAPKPHSEREPAITLASAAEYLSSRLTLNPNPVELENAADLMLDLNARVRDLEEQYGTLQAAARHVVAREVQARELVGCKTEPRLCAAIATLEGLVGSNPASEPDA